MEFGKLNYFYIDYNKKYAPKVALINATESEFKELLEGYISENESQDGEEFNAFEFTVYGKKRGYQISVGEWP